MDRQNGGSKGWYLSIGVRQSRDLRHLAVGSVLVLHDTCATSHSATFINLPESWTNVPTRGNNVLAYVDQNRFKKTSVSPQSVNVLVSSFDR